MSGCARPSKVVCSEVKDYRERRVLRREPALWRRPHQPVEWWEVLKEYQCVIDCEISQEMTALIRGRKRPNSGELARLLLEGGKPVWVPQAFWSSDIVREAGGVVAAFHSSGGLEAGIPNPRQT